MPEEFRCLVEEVEAEFNRNGTFFLEEAYLKNVQEKWNLFPNVFPELLEAAKALRNDPENACWALFVFRCMENREVFCANLSRFAFPEDLHPYIPLFCLIPTVERSVKVLQERNLPETVVRDILNHYEECVQLTRERTGKGGLLKRYFNWLQAYVDCRILNIDRLRFERITLQAPVWVLEEIATGEQVLLYGGGAMRADGLCAQSEPHQGGIGFFAQMDENETAYFGTCVNGEGRCEPDVRVFFKKEYRRVLAPGDNCLSVHIPAKSKGPLTEEACEASYAHALKLFREHYPEFPVKAFFCHSWMLSQEIRPLLPERSNLLAFQQKYRIFPTPSAGKDVFNFVFRRLNPDEPYETLPEETSLQRKIKQVYCDGGRVYEYGGIRIVSKNDAL